MYKIAKLQDTDKRVLFLNTAEKKGIHPSIIEKDYWVCLILDYLFHKSEWGNALIFKGGTSLSKAYHVVERFSEDIDLILDWRLLDYTKTEPWEERSKNQQDKLNKQMNEYTRRFIANQIMPDIQNGLSKLLGFKVVMEIDRQDAQTVNFMYPHLFENNYLRPEVRLEIGPLAEWIPNHEVGIISYVAEEYRNYFEMPVTSVKTLDVERTFWEKITILHKVANRDITKAFPSRYARHYYDLFCMYHSEIKEQSFQRKELLEQDIKFKMKFYASNHSGYDTARIGELRLMPKEEDMEALKEDYNHMVNMFFGTVPEYEDVIETIQQLEKEVNCLL